MKRLLDRGVPVDGVGLSFSLSESCPIPMRLPRTSIAYQPTQTWLSCCSSN
ncbi:hypothetical protein ACFQL7_06305 [Halocatena marina]|uniref:Uncharacterized protein n=1 Tax=Halocatena marina TaxID=2934937 RepID=A0ABD5YJU6_9EURY